MKVFCSLSACLYLHLGPKGLYGDYGDTAVLNETSHWQNSDSSILGLNTQGSTSTDSYVPPPIIASSPVIIFTEEPPPGNLEATQKRNLEL